MQKKKKKGGGWCETVPRHESQLHLMIAKGWSTCKLYCSSIVPPSTRRDHLSHQSQPALLPEHRRWIPAHHPCGYLCLTARKKESKAGYKAWKQHSFFLEARREDLRRPRWNASRHPSFLWIGAPTWHVLHAHANPFPFVFGSFSSESIPALKSKWASCALHVERWEGAQWELWGGGGARRANTRAAAAQRRLGACLWLSPNPDLIFVFDPQHGPETAWAATIAVI